MQWTSDAPTEAGWYWLRSAGEDDAEAVRLDGMGRVSVTCTGEKYRTWDYPECEWCGPLTPPA